MKNKEKGERAAWLLTINSTYGNIDSRIRSVVRDGKDLSLPEVFEIVANNPNITPEELDEAKKEASLPLIKVVFKIGQIASNGKVFFNWFSGADYRFVKLDGEEVKSPTMFVSLTFREDLLNEKVEEFLNLNPHCEVSRQRY
jgi:hypothetical protein